MNIYEKSVSNITRNFIRHKNILDTINLAYSTLAFAEPSDVICIPGPSQSGKSTTSKQLRKMLNPPGVDPDGKKSITVGVQATNCSTRGSFSTKMFAQKLVDALNHPIYADKSENVSAKDLSSPGKYETTMWRVIHHSLLINNKRYIFIDEAQNILFGGGSRGAGAILNSWKCVAEDAKSVLVLTGTYPILSAILDAKHVIGRTSIIHLPRYKYDVNGARHFSDILTTYQDFLPSDALDLNKHLDFILNGCLGCIGLLSRWLRTALAMAMTEKCILSFEIMNRAKLNDTYLRALYHEILEGEDFLAFMEEDKQSGNLLRDGSQAVTNRAEVAESNGSIRPKPFTVKAVRRKAGERVKGEVNV